MPSDLQVFPLAVTGGINQSAPTPQPTDYEELENFGIYRNRLGLRAPISVVASITSPATPTNILHITEHSNRLYVLSWSSSTQIVYLHSMQVDGSDIQSHGSVHTSVVTKPTLAMTSMTGGTAESNVARLYIFDYYQNLVSKYWDGTSINTVTADLNNDSTSEDVSFSLMIEYKFHLWGTGFYEGSSANRPEMLRFSQPGLVPGTDPAGGAASQEWYSADHRSVGRRGDKITALARAGDRLIVFQKRATHAVYGSGSATWTRQELSNVVGAAGPFAVTTAENRVCYFWASDGPYMTDGAQVQYIGEPIRELASSIDAATADIRAAYSPDEGLVYFIVSLGGADDYSLALIFNHRLGVWSKARWWDTATEYIEFGALASLDSVSAAGPAAAPTAISATATSDTNIDLVWTNGDTALGTITKIYRDTVSGFTPNDSSNLIAAVGTGVTNYSDTPPASDTTYYYKFIHYRNELPSAASNQVSDKTWLAEPSPVAISGLTNGLKVSGTNNASGADIRIERKEVGGTFALLTTLTNPGATFTHSDTTAVCLTTYVYRMRAENPPSTNSEWSAEVSREACDIGDPPAAPSGTTAVANSAGTPTTEMLVSWTDNSDNEEGFEVWRAPDVDGVSGTYAKLADEPLGNETSLVDTGLTSNTPYWYKVLAKNVAGSSAFSAEATGTTDPNLDAPTGMTAVAQDVESILVSWTENAVDESGYQIWLAEDNAGVPDTFSQYGSTLPADSTSALVTGLSSSSGGERYWIKVRAVLGAVNGPFSDPPVSDVLYSNAPAQVTGLTATNVAPTDSQIDLSWNNLTGETGYEIHRRVENGTYSGTPVATNPADDNTYSDTGLASGTTYYYKVRAYNATGAGPYSDEATASTTGSPPAPADPSGFTAVADNNDLNGIEVNAIDLAWTDNALNETGYEIERAAGFNSTNWIALITLPADTESYRDETVSPSTYYSYRVRAVNTGGQSNWVTTTNTLVEPNVTAHSIVATDASYCTGGTPSVAVPRLLVSWTNGGDGDDHVTRTLQRKAGGAGTWSDYVTGLTYAAQNYYDTGVSFGTAYRYRVVDDFGSTGENTGTFTSAESAAESPVDPDCSTEFG